MPTDYTSLPTADLIARLAAAGRAPHPDLIRALHERRAEAEPSLLTLFHESYKDDFADEDDPRWYRFLHAGKLLLAWRSTAALPVFANMYLDRRHQDMLEWYEEEPAHFGPPAMPFFLYVAATDTGPEWHYGRALATSILSAIARAHPETRATIVDAYRAILPPLETIATLTEEDADANWTTILGELGDLRDEGSRERGLAMFRAGLIDDSFFDEAWFLAALNGKHAQFPAEPVDVVAFYEGEYREAQAELARAAREARRADSQPQARPAQPAPAVKIGRNDPCPCGSGKKYKQCHGKPGG